MHCKLPFRYLNEEGRVMPVDHTNKDVRLLHDMLERETEEYLDRHPWVRPAPHYLSEAEALTRRHDILYLLTTSMQRVMVEGRREEALVQQEEGNEMGLSIFKAWRVRATNDAVRIEIEAKLGDHGMTSSYTTAMNLNVELPDENLMIEFVGQIINIHVKDVQHRIRHMMLADLLRGAGARIEMFEASPMPDTEWGQTQDQSQMPENISEPGEYAAQALMGMIEQMKERVN